MISKEKIEDNEDEKNVNRIDTENNLEENDDDGEDDVISISSDDSDVAVVRL